MKRLIKESYRALEKDFIKGLDIVVIARVSAKNADYKEIKSALAHLGRIHSIISVKEMKSRYDEEAVVGND